jgi:hypothetical protein
MRTKVTGRTPENTPPENQGWLNLEELAEVEVTSEEPEHPVEAALIPGKESGWRAALSGQQVIRLIFDKPQQIQRIWLRFVETEVERTQEFVLRWSSDGESFQEIVRQQWNFSPNSSVQEIEDFNVSLSGVALLELSIVPDKSRGDARASLADLRLG